MSSAGSETGSNLNTSSSNGEIIKKGYLRRLKISKLYRTHKKKFFVLKADSPSEPATLQYYDNKKDWDNNLPPKKTIVMKNCFSINRKSDTKHKHIIVLYIGVDCFSIILKCEKDLEDWLQALLIYQSPKKVTDNNTLKPYYEEVWKVSVQKIELDAKHKISGDQIDLAARYDIKGDHLLCLTETAISIVNPLEKNSEQKYYNFPLEIIRRYGRTSSFFYMELGQASILGAGYLWMQAEDTEVAKYIEDTIKKAFSVKELDPKQRIRSSSANEASRPISFVKKLTSSGSDNFQSQQGCMASPTTGHIVLRYARSFPLNSINAHVLSHNIRRRHSLSVSSIGDGILHHHHHHHNLSSVPFSPYPPIRRASTGTRPVTTGPTLLSSSRTTSYTGRARCDSLPTKPNTGNPVSLLTPVSSRPHSMYNKGIFSPTSCSHFVSPVSGTYSTESVASSLSVDGDSETWSEGDTTQKIIVEENSDEYMQWGGDKNEAFLAKNPPQNYNNIRRYPHSSNNSQQNSCSLYSSSPMDMNAYISKSPEMMGENQNRLHLNRSFDSVNHSRESSLHDSIEDYVPMAPLSVEAGAYFNMDQSCHKTGEMSSGISNCSVISGTPSNDARLFEFHLDKVSSCLTPSDDDVPSSVRPTRAYSAGSKPDADTGVRCDATDGFRVRAFSVGSRCGRNISLTPRRTPASTSASSIEHSDDLIEIDYSANKLNRLRSKLKHQSSGIVVSNEKLIAPTNSSTFAYSPSCDSSYMHMSTKSSPKLESPCCDHYEINQSPPSRFKYLITGRSPPTSNITCKQTFSKNVTNASNSNSTVLEKVMETESSNSTLTSTVSTKKSTNNEEDDSYVEMKPGVCDLPEVVEAINKFTKNEPFTMLDQVNLKSQIPRIKQPLLNTDDQLKSMIESKSMTMSYDSSIDRPIKSGSEVQLMSRVITKIPDKTPEGYIDMTFKNRRKNLTDSNTNKKIPENKNPPCCSGKENLQATRPCSKPITIQQGKNKRFNNSMLVRRKKEKPVSNISALNYDPNTKCAINSCGEAVHVVGDLEVQSAEGLERVDESDNYSGDCENVYRSQSNCNCNMKMPNNISIQQLQRKISDPLCSNYVLQRMLSRNEDSRNVLHRSSSVPITMAELWSSYDEFPIVSNKSEDELKLETYALIEADIQRKWDDILNQADKVPTTSPNFEEALRNKKDEIMYARLNIPQLATLPQYKGSYLAKNFMLPTTRLAGNPNLKYAQLYFDKSTFSPLSITNINALSTNNENITSSSSSAANSGSIQK